MMFLSISIDYKIKLTTLISNNLHILEMEDFEEFRINNNLDMLNTLKYIDYISIQLKRIYN